MPMQENFTAADLEREIAAETEKLNQLRAERKQLAVVALHDKSAAAQLQKVRNEEHRLSDHVEDLGLALSEISRKERQERDKLAEDRRQEFEERAVEKVRSLVPLAESIDRCMSEAAGAYKELITGARDAGELMRSANMPNAVAVMPISRIFHLRGVLWHYFSDVGGRLDYVGGAHRKPLAELVRAIAEGVDAEA